MQSLGSRSRVHPAFQAGVGVVFAATAGYAAHHVGPLEEHGLLPLAVALAMLVAVAVAASLARNRPLPTVVVARPGGGQMRPAERQDVPFSAALHRDALPHGFFAQLGPRFLRAYYRTFLDSPHAVFLVASVGGVPVGFLVGLLRPRAHARWAVRRRGIKLAAQGLVAMSVRPAATARFLRTRVSRYIRGWRRNRAAVAELPESPLEPAVVSHVAVTFGARGWGAGRRLVEAFVEQCEQAHITRIALVTLGSQEGAGDFYSSLGWRPGAPRTTPDGIEMVEWSLDLSSAEASR